MVGLKLDDVLTDLEFTGGSMHLPAHRQAEECGVPASALTGLSVNSSFTRRPAEADVISLEPYTQTTDAINLQARGVAAGLRVLGHGGQDTFVITMEAHE